MRLCLYPKSISTLSHLRLRPHLIHSPPREPHVIYRCAFAECATSSSPTPYYSNHDEYDLYTQNLSIDGSSQSPDEQDLTNEYQEVEHPLTYLSDHVGFLPLPHNSQA